MKHILLYDFLSSKKTGENRKMEKQTNAAKFSWGISNGRHVINLFRSDIQSSTQTMKIVCTIFFTSNRNQMFIDMKLTTPNNSSHLPVTGPESVIKLMNDVVLKLKTERVINDCDTVVYLHEEEIEGFLNEDTEVSKKLLTQGSIDGTAAARTYLEDFPNDLNIGHMADPHKWALIANNMADVMPYRYENRHYISAFNESAAAYIAMYCRDSTKKEPERKYRGKELYFSTDVESDGPIPGINSMISFASVVFSGSGEILGSFKANLRTLDGAVEDPNTMKWWNTVPDSFRKNKLYPKPAEEVMIDYVNWVDSFDCSPVFVAYPLIYDYLFMYWYMMNFVKRNPFSFNAIDMQTFAMAVMREKYVNSGKEKWPSYWKHGTPRHTHVPIDDAIEQGMIYCEMLKTRNVSWILT